MSGQERERMDTSKSLATDYALLEELGRGRFGRRVVLAQDRSHPTPRIVLRIAARTGVTKQDFLREYNYGLFLAPHSNVVETYEGSYENERSWWYVQEWAPCGSLRSLMEAQSGSVPETLTHQLLDQAMAGLEFIHEEGLVHRGLCAENLLLFPGPSSSLAVPESQPALDALRLKLADFRLMRKSGSRVTLENEVLGPYHPPEVCDLLQKEAFLAEQSGDVWAMGVLVFLLSRGRFPWPRATITTQPYYEWREWRKGNTHVPPKLFHRFTEKGLKIMKKSLAVKAKDRAAIKDLRKYLKDRWLREIKSTSDEDMKESWRRGGAPKGSRSLPTSPIDPPSMAQAPTMKQRKSIIHQWFATTLSAMSEISEQMVSAED